MFKSNLFKLRKNKRYNYTPRYFKGKELNNVYDFDSKFLKYRETYNRNDFGQQWKNKRLEMRVYKNRHFSMRLIIIIVLLTLLVLYILDFDLSIFTRSNS